MQAYGLLVQSEWSLVQLSPACFHLKLIFPLDFFIQFLPGSYRVLTKKVVTFVLVFSWLADGLGLEVNTMFVNTVIQDRRKKLQKAIQS